MNFNKISDFVKKNYKISIPIILLLVVFIAFILYYFVSKSNLFNKEETISAYQYYSVDKSAYSLKISKDSKGVIKSITPVEVDVVYDSTPIYDSKDGNIVIFPSKMSVVAPVMNCSEYLTNQFSYIKLDNKKYNLVTKKFNSALGHYFLYDGKDLYFFIEDVTLVVDGNKIELSPYSYVVAQRKKLSYYNKKDDKYVTLDTKSYDNYVYNEFFKVYVNGDYIESGSEKVLLTVDLDTLSDIRYMKRITD